MALPFQALVPAFSFQPFRRFRRSPPAFSAGAKLFSKKAPYQILSVLKEAKREPGAVRVYRALRGSPPFQQETALKIFDCDGPAFQAEWESLSRASALPCCVNLLGAERFAGGKAALVLEFVNGVTLYDLIRRAELVQEEIACLMIQIYRGLKSLSAVGLVHGDLSLFNILLTAQGRIRFIDFGKGNGRGRGTTPFTAPEVKAGFPADFTSDLFSLGVIEFFLKKRPLSLQKPPSDFHSSLLHEDPKKRRFPFFPSSENEGEGETAPAVGDEKPRSGGFFPNSPRRGQPHRVEFAGDRLRSGANGEGEEAVKIPSSLRRKAAEVWQSSLQERRETQDIPSGCFEGESVGASSAESEAGFCRSATGRASAIRSAEIRSAEIRSGAFSSAKPALRHAAVRRARVRLPAARGAALLLCFLVANAPSAGRTSREGTLKVRTGQWLQVKVNGMEKYTPLNAPLSPGRHRLLWKSQNNQGVFDLYIPPGKTLVLNDKDFQL